MKYYSLKYYEPDTQDYHTVKGFRKGYDYDSKNSATNIWFYKKLDFTPDLDLVLNPKAKATDLLESVEISSDYLCISPKFYDILKAHNLLEYQHFDAVIRGKKDILNYHFLNFYFRLTWDNHDIIDLDKTKFFAKKNDPFLQAVPQATEKGILGEFKVKSWSEFHTIRDQKENNGTHKIILPLDTLYIKNKKFLELDLFTLSFRNIGNSSFRFVISEKLAEAILDNKISGVKVEPLPFDIALS